MDIILSVENYAVSFGQKKVLTDVNLDIPDTGVTILMGPCGVGKSTLLRSLAGLNDSSSLFKSSGKVYYLGEPLGTINRRPAMLIQKAESFIDSELEHILKMLPERNTLSPEQGSLYVKRLIASFDLDSIFADKLVHSISELSLMERRVVGILSQIAPSPELIFIDEPTADLADEEAAVILSLVNRIAKQRAVVLVLHNQIQAKFFANAQLLLLAGGIVHENTTVETFFRTPLSEAGKEFVNTGSCAVPSADADPNSIDPDYAKRYLPVKKHDDDTYRIVPFGPSGFKWILREKLAATPRPGLFESQAFDLSALKKMKISQLITLEEEQTVSPEIAEKYAIQSHWFPVRDMSVPKLDELLLILDLIKLKIEKGHRVAIHCKAGLGRTGTVITGYLMHQGLSYESALQQVRCKDPRMVQSLEQEIFLSSNESEIQQANCLISIT